MTNKFEILEKTRVQVLYLSNLDKITHLLIIVANILRVYITRAHNFAYIYTLRFCSFRWNIFTDQTTWMMPYRLACGLREMISYWPILCTLRTVVTHNQTLEFCTSLGFFCSVCSLYQDMLTFPISSLILSTLISCHSSIFKTKKR